MTREEDLLRRYSAKQSQAAFAELVRRYLDFVYSVCRRQLGDPELAQEVTQTVFLILASKAASLKPGTVLSAWLFQVACHACRNARRVEARRRHYERKAGEDMQTGASGAQARALEPDLDDALARLNASDREAVLLRYVEEMSLDEVAAALGISAAAAHKRVSRALERLRRHFGPAGAALTAAALGLVLSETMVQAAPPAQAAAILGAVCGPGRAAVPLGAGTGGHAVFGNLGTQLALSKARLILGALLLVAAIAGLGRLSLHTVRARPAGRPAAVIGVPTQTLRGRVVDAAGKPASGASVTLLRYGASSGLASEFARVATDASGRYTVGAPVGPDGWAVVADSGQEIGFGTPGRDCRLLASTRLSLHLTGADGRPLPGVRVQPLILSVMRPDGRVAEFNLSAGCPDRLKLTSDGKGLLAFAGLPQGAVASFAVLDPRYVRRPPAADGLPLARGPQSGDVTVALMPGANVAGRVTYGLTGRPAAGVRVGAQQVGPAAAWGEAETDADGRYQIVQLGPGRYNIAVDEQSPPLAGGWTAAAAAGVFLSAGRPSRQMDLRLVRGGLITGTVKVRGSGQPAGGVEIGAYGPAHPATGIWVGGGWTDGGGAYRIRVSPGRQHVYPMSGAAAGRGADVTVGDGQNAVVDFGMPPGR